MWNYRLFKQDAKLLDYKDKHGKDVYSETGCFVAECYYDENGNPEMHSTLDHNIVLGDTPEETKETYDMIGEAFRAPVIELDGDGNFKKSKETTNDQA